MAVGISVLAHYVGRADVVCGFPREEIEKHNAQGNCWIVINGKVYDATSVLEWHPGGKAPIMAHAGKVHADTTEEFESIHDDYAEQKLRGIILTMSIYFLTYTNSC